MSTPVLVLAGPAADPDDPLDPLTCFAPCLTAVREVIELRTGRDSAADPACPAGAPVVAFTGPWASDALALAVATRKPTVLALTTLGLMPLRMAQAARLDAVAALGACLAVEEPAVGADAAWLDWTRLAGPLSRQGAGVAPLLRRARAVLAPDRDLLDRFAALAGGPPPGGLHLLSVPVEPGRIGRLATAAPCPARPRIVAVGGRGGARVGFTLLRGLAAVRAQGMDAEIAFAGASAAPPWPLRAAAAGIGLGDRVSWHAVPGRGALARLIATAAGVVALERGRAVDAVTIARALARPAAMPDGGAVPEGAVRLPEPGARAAVLARFVGVAVCAGPARPDPAVLAAHDPGRLVPGLLAAVDAAMAGVSA